MQRPRWQFASVAVGPSYVSGAGASRSGSGRASLIFRVVQQGLGRARRCSSRVVVGGDGRGLVSLAGVPAAQMMRPGARAAISESELKGEVRRVLAGAMAAVVMAVTGGVS